MEFHQVTYEAYLSDLGIPKATCGYRPICPKERASACNPTARVPHSSFPGTGIKAGGLLNRVYNRKHSHTHPPTEGCEIQEHKVRP